MPDEPLHQLVAEMRALRQAIEQLHVALFQALTPLRNGVAPPGEVKVKPLLAEWIDRWRARYGGEAYVANGAKDGAQLKRMDKTLGRVELLARMDRFLADESEYVVQARHSFGLFVSSVNRYGNGEPKKALDGPMRRMERMWGDD